MKFFVKLFVNWFESERDIELVEAEFSKDYGYYHVHQIVGSLDVQ